MAKTFVWRVCQFELRDVSADERGTHSWVPYTAMLSQLGRSMSTVELGDAVQQRERRTGERDAVRAKGHKNYRGFDEDLRVLSKER